VCKVWETCINRQRERWAEILRNIKKVKNVRECNIPRLAWLIAVDWNQMWRQSDVIWPDLEGPDGLEGYREKIELSAFLFYMFGFKLGISWFFIRQKLFTTSFFERAVDLACLHSLYMTTQHYSYNLLCMIILII